MSKLITSGAKIIITDYYHLPSNFSDWWVHKYTDNFLIYDKAHRFIENKKIKHQKNVGENIYDFYDFVCENYENLPDIMIFCKGDVIPRHCSVEKFEKIVNSNKFVTIENYARNVQSYSKGVHFYVDENDQYHENNLEVDNVVRSIHKSKYAHSFKELIDGIFINPIYENYIKFPPGANFIISKNEILRFNKKFYEKMKNLVSWEIRPGEAFLLERALCTIFEKCFEIKNEYKNIQ